MTALRAFRTIGHAVFCAGLLLPVLAGTPLRAESPAAREVGCYPDNPRADPAGTKGRDLDGAAFNNPAMTVTQCQRLCTDQGFTYAGLQDGSWCFCGNSYGRYKTGTATCTTKCAGDEKQTCGGKWANSIWELVEGRADAPVQEPVERTALTGPQLAADLQRALKNLGCYTLRVDGDWGRGSRAAVRRFNSVSGMSLPADSPTQKSLEAVSGWEGGNCEAVTKRTEPGVSGKRRRSRSTRKKSSSSGRIRLPGSGSIRIIIGPGGIGIGY